jgi:hypothetical protein
MASSAALYFHSRVALSFKSRAHSGQVAERTWLLFPCFVRPVRNWSTFLGRCHGHWHIVDETASCVVKGAKAALEINDAERTVDVPSQDHIGPIQVRRVMHDRAEDDTCIVGEPLDRLMRVAIQRHARGAEPAEFLCG